MLGEKTAECGVRVDALFCLAGNYLSFSLILWN